MKRLFCVFGLISAMLCSAAWAQVNSAALAQKQTYGKNAERGRFVDVNGTSLYVEDYGAGQVVLGIHGNDGNIATLSRQLDALIPHYRVVAADSRGQGRSSKGTDHLTYELMAEDFNALLDQLKLSQVYVYGVSDGGIIGLLLAMRHPDKVAKLAITGAALNPAGAQEWAMPWCIEERDKARRMIARGDTSRDWQQALVLLELLMTQPNIDASELRRVAAPTLVMAGDNDIIRLDHTIDIQRHIAKSQLAIFPGSTHFAPLEQPELFNSVLLRFFQREFRRPDTRDYLK
jgi:pimeloyl-ACP methyl ester carboxylesterase